jgi:hypothetical protein
MTDTPTPQPDLSEAHLEFLADAALSVNASKPTLVAMLRSVRDQARAAERKRIADMISEPESAALAADSRIRYVSVQMDKEDYYELRRAAAEGGKDA